MGTSLPDVMSGLKRYVADQEAAREASQQQQQQQGSLGGAGGQEAQQQNSEHASDRLSGTAAGQ
jgi:hypothetical protein